MAIITGRQQYLGLAIESTAGTPEASPSVFLPITEQSLQLQNEKILDVSIRANRVLNHDSISGKEWTQGDLGMYLDASNSGYLFKLALGNEVKTNVDTGVDNHQFYVTVSGNTPKTATTWLYRGSTPAVQQASRMAIDSLELEIANEGLATMTASFIGGKSNESSAPTLTTTSGNIFTWADGCLRIGDTVAEARNAQPTKITNFTTTINNNLETIFRCGSSEVDEIIMGNVEVLGDFTVFFEDDTLLNLYKNNTKKAMIVTLTGADLGGQSEKLELIYDRVVLTGTEFETGADDPITFTGSFTAINDTNQQIMTVNLQNGKTTLY